MLIACGPRFPAGSLRFDRLGEGGGPAVEWATYSPAQWLWVVRRLLGVECERRGCRRVLIAVAACEREAGPEAQRFGRGGIQGPVARLSPLGVTTERSG